MATYDLTGSEVLKAAVEDMFNLITDRTQADVERVRALRAKGWANMTAAERTEWSSAMKGAYNATDLHRVSMAAAYIVERLNGYGYNIQIPLKLDWNVEEIPTPTQMQEYFDNIAYLRSVIALLPSSPAAPSDINGFSYVEANNIEQILIDIDTLLTNAASSWFYSGDLYANEI